MNRRFLKQVAPLLISLAIVGGLSLFLRKFEREAPRPFDRLLVEVLPEIPDLSAWPASFLKKLEEAHAGLEETETQRDSLVELAYLYHANGFSNQAQSCYLGLESFETQNGLWPYLMGVLNSNSRDKREVAEHFVRALKLDPTHSLAYLRLGHAYREAGLLDEAAKAYEYRLLASPRDAWAMASLGQVALYADEPEEAVRWLERARVIEPDLELVFDLLPEAYMDLEDFEAARTVRLDGQGRQLRYEFQDPALSFMEKYCFDASRLVRYARNHREDGELQKSVSLLERALELDPEHPEIVDGLQELTDSLGTE